MDSSCVILTCLLLMQMIMTLYMLNPVYDVCKITNYIDCVTKQYRKSYFALVGAYFSFVIYLGMYIPLQNIQILIFSNSLSSYEKLLLLGRIEKNYIIAGFSLFLVVVVFGVRALLTYAASLLQLARKSSEPVNKEVINNNKVNGDILPHLLKVKRSISYEAILCPNELKEQLKIMMKNINLLPSQCTLSNILETSSDNINL